MPNDDDLSNYVAVPTGCTVTDGQCTTHNPATMHLCGYKWSLDRAEDRDGNPISPTTTTQG